MSISSGYLTAPSSATLSIYEVEIIYNQNKALYHVRIPEISSTTDTVFKLKFNGSGYASGNNPTSVWDSNYVMVQHMGDSLVDSTGNGNNGTATGTTVVDGFNGKARNFDGIDDVVSLSNMSITSIYSSIQNVSANEYIGSRGDLADFHDGEIDEFRISNIARSDAWIKAEYEFLMNDRLVIVAP